MSCWFLPPVPLSLFESKANQCETLGSSMRICWSSIAARLQRAATSSWCGPTSASPPTAAGGGAWRSAVSRGAARGCLCGSATAAASKDELVQALHVLLPPRGTVIVIVQAVLAEGYGPGGAGGRPHAGKMLTDTSGPLGGAIPFGRVAITPPTTRGGEGTRYLDAVERGSASARAPPAHASAVQLLWRPPPPAAATLRLEPPDLAFNNVLVGVAAEVAPSAKFEIVNTGQTEMNFMLMLRREESDERNDGRGKRDSEKDRKGSGALDRSEKE